MMFVGMWGTKKNHSLWFHTPLRIQEVQFAALQHLKFLNVDCLQPCVDECPSDATIHCSFQWHAPGLLLGLLFLPLLPHTSTSHASVHHFSKG
jgi:hypothetical protein